ncbi:MAG: L-threonylcarbamoyladenylate synthase [Gammaproteobacteria bacterium]|nr:L-threonylcarbamoyladenylate synthase [Gammaproteobacteria bacterium]MBL6819300.1 L-threonylcarbamoyladenylate synthase [Gammaproteobacteria bacterium]MBL6898479.1 L-threonylcarbamoyladenylate synthase [Gammaproteobacteria bacterium]
MIPKVNTTDASVIIKNGGVVIYPTEGIYGIGCDPYNKHSVEKIFQLKGRDYDKRFILISSQAEFLTDIIDIDIAHDERLKSKDFMTWIVPANNSCPSWLKSDTGVAVRITQHSVVKDLCNKLGGPIISTSANYSNQEYINDISIIEKLFDGKVSCIVNGKLGNKKKPSTVRNIITNEVLRR